MYKTVLFTLKNRKNRQALGASSYRSSSISDDRKLPPKLSAFEAEFLSTRFVSVFATFTKFLQPFNLPT